MSTSSENKPDGDPGTAPAKRQTAAERAQAVRKARLRKLATRAAIWVGLPTIVAVMYYGFWTSDQYESVAQFTVQTSPGAASHAASPAEAAAAAAVDPARDTALLRDLIGSRALLERLIADSGFVEHYRDADRWSRLEPDAGSESTYEYYRDRVDVTSRESGILTLRVRAFSGEQAHALADDILALSEAMLQDVVTRTYDDREARLRKRVAAAAARAEQARAALRALEAAGTDPGSEPYAAAQVERQVATSAWQGALEAVESLALRREVDTRYLVRISGPSFPDQASYPRRGWGILTVFVLSLVLMGVLGLLGGAVREHAKF